MIIYNAASKKDLLTKCGCSNENIDKLRWIRYTNIIILVVGNRTNTEFSLVTGQQFPEIYFYPSDTGENSIYIFEELGVFYGVVGLLSQENEDILYKYFMSGLSLIESFKMVNL